MTPQERALLNLVAKTTTTLMALIGGFSKDQDELLWRLIHEANMDADPRDTESEGR